MPLTPGTRLGTYEIVSPLGAGGMGEVYCARDSRLGREVAIKALPASLAADPERRARFEREAQILASLSHPNIGAIFGLEDASGVPYLVLELVPGETLAARLERGALALRDALAVAVQMAAAIEAAHERGVVHRDLKPGNVMLTPAGTVKVLDFGLAKGEVAFVSDTSSSMAPTVVSRPDDTVAGSIIGTVAYMSPEQARGNAVDRRSDIWSFACVLFECLAARAAFEGATASDRMARILERDPDWSLLPASVPARVRELLRRCLRKNADERPRDIRDVRLELADVAGGGDKAEAAREKSVAVLPFENLSGPDDEYFADGITDEILNALSQLDGLRVAARTSCFAFKGRREDLRAVGEKLQVSTVLEGSVRRAGNRLRITVQLVNAADGYQLWSERYDREMTDVFEVQDQIAAAITQKLRGDIAGDADQDAGKARRGTDNLEAFELALKGRALQLKRGRFLLQSIRCFEQAIALDPKYTEPMAWLADSYRLLGTFGLAPCPEVMPRAKALAMRALEIDPGSPEANATVADVLSQHERNWPAAAEYFARALATDPRHVRARCERSMWGHAFGAYTWDEAIAECRRARGDDPLNSWVIGMESMGLGFAGRHEVALRVAEEALAADGESFFAQWNLLRAHGCVGAHDKVIELAPGVLAVSGRHHWVMGTLAWSFCQSGRPEKARAVYEELAARASWEFVGPVWLALAADAAGLRDEALRLVQKG
ncbi:MAG: protein kinase, partial [Rubrivivax sp.]|nr:protein kinase [Rubrivivax sp.]